jgi:serine/threonine protein kinase
MLVEFGIQFPGLSYVLNRYRVPTKKQSPVKLRNMTIRPKEEVFQRHPRPQLPTKAALLLESRNRKAEKPKASLSKEALLASRKIVAKMKSPNEQNTTRAVHHGTPWKKIDRLGELIQGHREWYIGLFKGKMVMLRKTELDAGQRQYEKVKLLAHPNIANLEEVFEGDSSFYFRYEYSRFTLEEVLNVHLRFEESQILTIACSVCL